MKNNPSGISSFYRSHENSHHTFRTAVELRESIDEQALREAVDTALTRYDYYSVKFIQEEGEVLHSVVPNTRPVVITRGVKPVLLLSEESNEHALAIAYEDKTIYFDIVHSITDATGIFELVKTTLYYYMIEKHGAEFPADHIRTVHMPVTDEERTDPYLNPSLSSSEEDAAPGKKSPFSPAVEWERIMPVDRSRQTVCKMSVSEETFMEYVHAGSGTPSIVTSNLLAEAVFDLCGKLDDPFRIALMKNYRPALGTLLAHNNVIGNIILNYTDEMRILPMEQLCGIMRQMAAYQSTDEFVLAAVRKRLQGERQILALRDQSAIRAAFRQKAEENLRQVNLTVSYLRLDLPEALRPYVEAIYTYVDPSPSHIVVEINAVNGQFCFTFQQNFTGDLLVRAFADRLKRAGIPVQMGEEQPLICPRMKM